MKFPVEDILYSKLSFTEFVKEVEEVIKTYNF